MASARPRVGIDAHFLSRLEGNRTHVLSLLRALARGGAGERFELVACSTDPRRDRAVLGPEADAFRWPRLPAGALLRFVVGVPWVQARERLDVWLATFVAPPGRARLVLSVHDALALTRPELLPPAVARRLRLLLPRSVERAARVLVPTEAVRRDLEGQGLGLGRTVVAPIGVDGRVFSPSGERRGGAYVLAVGRDDPRKRLDLLVRAFARARLVSGGAPVLVLAGPLAGSRERLEALAGREGLARGALEVVPSPSEGQLAALYRGARALAFPSAGEGLGLPIVEALACGTPVVASDLAAHREAAGGAALALVPPDDLAALAAGLQAALTLGDEARARLAALGVARAEAFSLARVAGVVEQSIRDAARAPA